MQLLPPAAADANQAPPLVDYDLFAGDPIVREAGPRARSHGATMPIASRRSSTRTIGSATGSTKSNFIRPGTI
jgi:hypothetical protein